MKMRFLRALIALVLALAPVGVYAQQIGDVPITFANFSVSAIGQTPYLQLQGQGTCAITFTSVGASATIVAQGASDARSAGVQTPITVTGIGTGGTITNPAANSVFSGIVSPQALTYFRLNFTAVSGTYAGSITCSDAPPGVVYEGGLAPGATRGLGVMYYGVSNTPNQPCWGISSASGTVIPGINTVTTLVASSTQVVVTGVGGSVAHVCSYDLTGVLTTGATFSIVSGTGSLCGTGTVTMVSYVVGVGNTAILKGSGAQDLLSAPTGASICVTSGAFAGTAIFNTDTSIY